MGTNMLGKDNKVNKQSNLQNCFNKQDKKLAKDNKRKASEEVRLQRKKKKQHMTPSRDA